MLIEVGRGFAYEWDEREPLHIGDGVELPPPWWGGKGEPFIEHVSRLGSDYNGPVKSVVRKVAE